MPTPNTTQGYKTRDVCTVVEVVYKDGNVLYELTGNNKEGLQWSSGLFNFGDLLIEITKHVGKIPRNTKTYLDKYIKQ